MTRTAALRPAVDIRPAPRPPRTVSLVAANQWPLPLDGNLALSLDRPVPTRPRLRLVGAGDEPAREELEQRARRFVQALVEVAAGVRPLTQMSRWMTSEVYDEFVDRLALLSRARTRRGPSTAPRARVVSVHVFQPGTRSAEVSARVAHGPRSRALAVRLDLTEDARGNGRWACTALTWG